MKKIVKVGICLLLLVIVLLIGIFVLISFQPAVPKDFVNKVKTGSELEYKYLQKGNYNVSYMENGAMQSFKKYEIWYPSEIKNSSKKYPVVVMVNGTGVKASKYTALFEHLASWGFICIGNEEEYSWNGFSAEMCLRTLLKLNENEDVEGYDNVFYQKIDMDAIGICGHSQGGVGVINAITEMKHHDIYKCAVLLSPSNELLSEALDWSYDASKVNASTLLLSGLGQADENLVVNLEQLTSIYQHLPDTIDKVMARRKDADHGDMLYYGEGIVVAWLLWQLQNDKIASQVFVGDAQLFHNEYYQDQVSNINHLVITHENESINKKTHFMG
ncbi:MAG: alpha/beta hydrolase family protein, partial [Traorella sp.]